PRRLVPAATLAAITHDRVTDRGEMDPDLVGPPRGRGGLEEARSRQTLTEGERGRGGTPLRTIDHDPGRVATERRLDGEALVFGMTSDQREVPAVDVVTPEDVPEGGVRRVRLRDDQQTARPGIEPVHDAGSKGATGVGEGDAHPEQPVDQRAGPVTLRRMGDQPCWF